MDNYFYNNLSNINYSKDFLESIKNFANKKKKQIYVLSNPLTDNRYSYDYRNAYIILTPKRKILFIKSTSEQNDDDAFADYIDDVKLDIAAISDKFDFKEHLGRPREWKNLFGTVKESDYTEFEDLYNEMHADEQDFKKIEILIV